MSNIFGLVKASHMTNIALTVGKLRE